MLLPAVIHPSLRQERYAADPGQKSARYRPTLWLAFSQQAIIRATLVPLVLLVLATKGGSSVLGHTEAAGGGEEATHKTTHRRSRSCFSFLGAPFCATRRTYPAYDKYRAVGAGAASQAVRTACSLSLLR